MNLIELTHHISDSDSVGGSDSDSDDDGAEDDSPPKGKEENPQVNKASDGRVRRRAIFGSSNTAVLANEGSDSGNVDESEAGEESVGEDDEDDDAEETEGEIQQMKLHS